ncbi:MAG: serine hydrolase, partial [Planctomycetota bacterium]
MAAPLLEPWLALPRIESTVRLIDSGADLDGLFDMPDGSTLTVASVDMATGDLHTARWRGTGDVGFYPASTIKWITAAMAVAWMDQHDMSPETVIQLGDERPATMRELILSSLMMSDNDAFNTLQESVGFAETYAAMKNWGVQHVERVVVAHHQAAEDQLAHRRGAFVAELDDGLGRHVVLVHPRHRHRRG